MNAGATVTFNGSFESLQNPATNTASVSASTVPGDPPSVSDVPLSVALVAVTSVAGSVVALARAIIVASTVSIAGLNTASRGKMRW